MTSKRDDPFSRVNYRSLIAWPERIAREAPFLERVLDPLPERSVVDLGCGSGEHSRFLAAIGFATVGLDRSPAMIESAREEPLPDNLRFVEGDIREAPERTGRTFGAAVCLGNAFPFLTGEDELTAAIGAVGRVLKPGGRFLFQVLNYEGLYARKERNLPLNFRPAPDAGREIVFVRIFTLLEGGRVLFFPTTLALDPGAEEPVTVERTRRVELRAWQRPDFESRLAAAGFGPPEWFGTMTGEPFAPRTSPDLVGLATKEQ